MKKVKITALKRAVHEDLISLYENPIEHACDLKIGQSFISVNGEMPAGFCQSAWSSLCEWVERLSQGESDFYGGWMKNPYSAMISCNDGFRPVSFYLEVIDE